MAIMRTLQFLLRLVDGGADAEDDGDVNGDEYDGDDDNHEGDRDHKEMWVLFRIR